MDGWSGTQCQQDINECLSGPCLNGAVCINSPAGSFQCFCQDYWTGTLCDEDVVECQAMPPLCRNGGVCIEQVRGSVGTVPNFMALLTVSTESALTEAGNSLLTSSLFHGLVAQNRCLHVPSGKMGNLLEQRWFM